MYSDGHTHCFSCGKTTFDVDQEESSQGPSKTPSDTSFLRGTYTSIPSRRLTEETTRFWSYMMVQWFDVTTHCANYLSDNRATVAQKMRTKDKEFPWINRAGFKGLYGQWLWRSGGKKVIITEGEIDAMSVSQVQNHKWPVVSLPDGAQSATKAIKEALPWLSTFEQIVLWFDNDEAGREAVDKVKRLLPPGKCYITWSPEGFKDAGDLLVSGKSKAIIDCIWGAKQYRPEGLVSGQDIIDRYNNRPEVVSYPYPEEWEEMNYKVKGIRMGELDVWTSGTGMGKTTIIKALQNHYFHSTDFNQALIHLEEPLEDTAEDLISYEIGTRLSLGETPVEDQTRQSAADALFLSKDPEGNHRFVLYDAFGAIEDDSLYDTIRYLATACGVRVFWLDHLSILVSDMDQDGDERRKIDSIMSKLKNLTVELDIYVALISHLRKPPGQGKSFEEGAVPSLDDLRGSGGIKQLANGVFTISRNQQAESSTVRNTSSLTVLKCRKTGRTGPADHLMFDQVSGRLSKGSDPADADREQFNDEDGEY